MQLFLEQQQTFRQQMGNLLGQTPWTAMNQLTERNLELWQEFQRGLAGSLGRPTTPRERDTTPPGKTRR